jgi:hypothetical protein
MSGCCFILVLCAVRALAQDVAVADIPDSLPAASQSTLKAEQVSLLARVNAFNQQVDAFNGQCGSLDSTQTAAIAACRQQMAALQAQKDTLAVDKRAFAAQVQVEVANAAKAKPPTNSDAQREAICGVDNGDCIDARDAVAECSGANCGGGLSKEQRALLQAREAAASVPSANCVIDGRKGCDRPVAMADVVIQGESLKVPDYAKNFIDAIPKDKRTPEVQHAIDAYELDAKVRGEAQNNVLADKARLAKDPKDPEALKGIGNHEAALKLATTDETNIRISLSRSIGLLPSVPKPKPVEVPSPQLPKGSQ